jgi:hypothetical protein
VKRWYTILNASSPTNFSNFIGFFKIYFKEMASTSRSLSYNGKYIERKKKKHRFKCENIHPRCNENYITENWWEKKK